MKYLVILVAFLAATTLLATQAASAQLAENKAYSMIGSGFATTSSSILDADIDLSFVTTKIKNTVGIDFQEGVITVNDNELILSDLKGTILSSGKIFRFTAKASNSGGEEFSIRGLGKLIDKTTTDSLYSLSITMTDPQKATAKLVQNVRASEYSSKTTQATKSGITIKILEGSANPNERTYKDQLGLTFKYFSEDRITILPGETITFVNEDTVSHSLKSGTANYVSRHKTFDADGKISSGEILPGKSWSVTFDEPGFYRLFDEDYQWMDITAFVFDMSERGQIKSNRPLN